MLVTHDRYMLDRVSTIVLGLNGTRGAESFADYSQWEVWQAESKRPAKAGSAPDRGAAVPAESQSGSKKKLSYLEAREYATIEQRVADADLIVQTKHAQLEDPAIASDGPSLLKAHAEMEEAQEKLDALYARWAELEKKNG